jgi:hypothetical protein
MQNAMLYANEYKSVLNNLLLHDTLKKISVIDLLLLMYMSYLLILSSEVGRSALFNTNNMGNRSLKKWSIILCKTSSFQSNCTDLKNLICQCTVITYLYFINIHVDYFIVSHASGLGTHLLIFSSGIPLISISNPIWANRKFLTIQRKQKYACLQTTRNF